MAMKRMLAGIVAMAAVPSGASVPAPVAPPPQVIQRLVSWTADVARCDGRQIPFVRLPVTNTSLTWGASGSIRVEYRFRIDAEGRPLGIVRDRPGPLANPDSSELAPALAAAWFPAGTAATTCAMGFVGDARPIDQATLEQAVNYTLFQRERAPYQLWKRARPVGSDCFDQPPAPLLRRFPDFAALPGTPGVQEWTMIGHDIDEQGRPTNVRVIGGTGNQPLDLAGVRALQGSRFVKGARKGCLFPFYRSAGTLATIPAPKEDTMRPVGANCPPHLPYARQPTLTFPQQYQKRGIEGWAVIAYDVAPWGVLGNLRVLAAEPSSDFGDWAKRVIGAATKPASTTGYVGCVDQVLFRMGPAGRLIVDGRSTDTAERVE